ncbi:MAG TPA: 3-phosphoshikimate 1-carboxyvinyltransferase [Bdellovibrionales bacterium]|nr:3-phosphoshikimate 1-carboxyvinyltransferase [Bdellovibrionales bacterium]
MNEFRFIGKIPASKSMLNRAWLAKSFAPELEIAGESHCDDVERMKEAVQALQERRAIEVGSAGTVLRFMTLRAAREPGEHVLKGEKSLFARPQDELVKILKQLGVEARLGADRLELTGQGWRVQGDTLLVETGRSSQFASGVLLNAWNLPFDLYVSLGGRKVSEGYWKMSVQMAQDLGLKIDFWDGDFRVPRYQMPTVPKIHCEIDMSSAFVLGAIAAVAGHATLLEFPDRSLQPDAVFADVLRAMGAEVKTGGGRLEVHRARTLRGVAVNLASTPDLFPVLAALGSLAEGETDLFGAAHLAHKESNRLERMAEMLRQTGREIVLKDDGMKIFGPLKGKARIAVDGDQDHRLAFAAAVLKYAGHDVSVEHPEVVTKSFPEFWNIVGWQP